MVRTFLFLFVFVSIFCAAVIAQVKYSKPVFAGLPKKIIVGNEYLSIKAVDYYPINPIFDEAPNIPGSVVGYTFYDFMTNGSLGKGFIRWKDFTMASILMAAIDSTSSTSTRGSYYNFFKNGQWKDTTNFWRRIQTNIRCGWGRIDAFSDKTIFTIAHPNLVLSQNIGTWDNPVWVTSVSPSPYIWYKFAMDDNNSSYYGIWFCGGINGGNAPLNIFGSTDAGATWIFNDFSLKSFISTSDTALISNGYMGWSAEDYGVDAAKGKVAFAGFKRNGNVYAFISSNKGTSWTYKKIYDGAKIDTTLETIPFDSSFFPQKRVKMLNIPYCDGTGDVLIDDNGIVHVTWGTFELGYRILVDSLGNPIRNPNGKLQREFFVTDFAKTGIWYWNSNLIEPVSAVKPDSYLIDSSLGVFDKITHVPRVINHGMSMGIIGMPSLAKDTLGHTFIVFQGFRNKDTMSLSGSNIPFAFGHVYITASHNGTNWQLPKDFFGYSINKEDVCFPFTASYADYSVHIIVQNDKTPGNWLQNGPQGHPQNKNYFVHASYPVFINDAEDAIIKIDFKLEQNYPNPFNPVTTINYQVPAKSFVSLKIFDILGREITTLVNEEKQQGKYSVEFDGSRFSSGVYLYELKAGEFRSVKKMTLLK